MDIDDIEAGMESSYSEFSMFTFLRVINPETQLNFLRWCSNPQHDVYLSSWDCKSYIWNISVETRYSGVLNTA